MASTEKLIRITLKLQDEMSKELDKSANSLKKMGDQLTSVGTKMTAAFTVPIVAAGAAAVKLASDLDKSMRNIQSITKQTDESLAELSASLVALSTDMSKTTDSAQNLADGYYQIISSGIDAADAMKVLEVATKAASAGLTTTEVAAKGIITVLNSYKLGVDEASRVSDILFETVNRGVGSFEELNAALSNVVPTASIMGISLEEVSAGMATLSKNGFSFSEASVAMNAAMSALLSPTEAMSKAINEMGYESGQAMVDALGFAGTMQEIAKHTGGSSEELAKLFPEIRGFRAAAILAGSGAEMFAEDLAAMEASTGATQAAFAEQMKSFDATFKNFQNTVSALLIDIGNTLMPVLTAIMQAITPVIQGFMALPTPIKQIILVVLALVAAIGPLLLIFGQIAGAISAIMTIWPALVAAFSGFGTVIALILSPLGLFVAAVAIAVAAIMGNWFGLRDALVGSVGAIVGAVSQVGDAFKGVGSMIAEGWSKAISVSGNSLSQLAQIVWKRFTDLGSQMIQIGYMIMQGLMKGVLKGAIDLIAAVLNISQQIQTAIKKSLGIASPSKVFMKIGQNVVEGFNQGIESMGGGLGVNVPQAQGGNSRNPSLAVAGAGASGGGGMTNYNTFILPEGTTDRQVREISKKLGAQAERLGARKAKR